MDLSKSTVEGCMKLIKSWRASAERMRRSGIPRLDSVAEQQENDAQELENLLLHGLQQ